MFVIALCSSLCVSPPAAPSSMLAFCGRLRLPWRRIGGGEALYPAASHIFEVNTEVSSLFDQMFKSAEVHNTGVVRFS